MSRTLDVERKSTYHEALIYPPSNLDAWRPPPLSELRHVGIGMTELVSAVRQVRGNILLRRIAGVCSFCLMQLEVANIREHCHWIRISIGAPALVQCRAKSETSSEDNRLRLDQWKD